MKRNDLYLIYEETYLDHINEKVQLYTMVKLLCQMAKALPANRDSKDLTKLATVFEERSKAMFKTWKIPESYLVSGKEEDLIDRIVEDLWVPEILGYYHRDDLCDDCCPCGEECPYCEECDDDIDEDEFDPADEIDETEEDDEPDEGDNDKPENENIGEMFAILGEVLHSLFGDNVSVHVFRE